MKSKKPCIKFDRNVQGWDFITTLTVKWLVLDNQSELSELMTVVYQSQYACIPLPTIGIKNNI